MRRIKLKSVRNIRDFGGIINRNGNKIKRGLFIRSGVLFKLTPKDIETLYGQYNLKTIIDLRTKKERTEKPDTFPDNVDYISIPVVNDSTEGVTHEEEEKKEAEKKKDKFDIGDMEEVYRNIVTDEGCIKSIKNVLFEICKAYKNGPVLWHCSEGKDRCGIISALFLSLLDVDTEEIFNDYLLTNRTAKRRSKKFYYKTLFKTRNRKAAQSIRKAFIADRRYLQAAFDAINEKYGSVESYLADELNITEDMKSSLKEHCLISEGV